eukprot:653537-Rhodomonas_salina.5
MLPAPFAGAAKPHRRKPTRCSELLFLSCPCLCTCTPKSNARNRISLQTVRGMWFLVFEFVVHATLTAAMGLDQVRGEGQGVCVVRAEQRPEADQGGDGRGAADGGANGHPRAAPCPGHALNAQACSCFEPRTRMRKRKRMRMTTRPS